MTAALETEQLLAEAKQRIASWPESAEQYRGALQRQGDVWTATVEMMIDGTAYPGCKVQGPDAELLREHLDVVRSLLADCAVSVDPEVRRQAANQQLREALLSETWAFQDQLEQSLSAVPGEP